MKTSSFSDNITTQPKRVLPRISGSEAVIRSFMAEGVETIFGYPGGAIIPVYNALYDYRDRINHILVRHEQGALHGFLTRFSHIPIFFPCHRITNMVDCFRMETI